MPGLVSSPRGGLDMRAVEQLTNPSDINKLLHESLATERTIDAGLEQMLARRRHLEAELLSLTEQTAEVLEVVHADADQLLSSVRSTATVAEQISGRVKELDFAQSRVKQVLGDIHVVMDRTTCVTRLQRAMTESDYEGAAQCIGQFRQLEGRLESDNDLQQKQIVDECESQLEEIVRSRFNSAVDDSQGEEVARFTKLFKPLNKKDEGLRRFIDYLKSTVANQAMQTYSDLSSVLEGPQSDKADFVAALSATFKSVALAVEENEEVLKQTFGVEAVLEAITSLQHECDSRGSKIIQRYLEARRLPRLVKEVGLRKHKDMALMAGTTTLVDPREVENFLQEVLLLCQRSEEYNQFMLGKMSAAIAPNPLSPIRETTFRGGQLNVSVRELVGYYITLEEYYMEENVKKAIEINEQIADSLTSSMVDDVFFILRKCATRAMATSNLQCVCSVLSLMNSILGQSLMAALQKKLLSGPSKFMTAVASESQIPAESNFPLFLNNAEVSANYIMKLKSELEGYVANLFGSIKDRNVVNSVLADLSRTSGEVKSLSTRALDQLTDSVMHKLKSVLDDAAGASYELSEAEYSANEIEDTWVQRMLVEMDNIIAWLTPLLTTTNLDANLHLLLDRIASRIEALMMRKRFNQLGGLQLDRDVRAIVSHLSETSQRTVRDKFARLTQVATVVCLESVDEILDYWGDDGGAVTWRLTPGEIKSIMRLRVDFPDDGIAALSL
ncbi:hypothetical protein BSKO_01249 [Bryopsis sp. KO-2023]|nr:hypothetical protein BSKO_01249 [Bryopsis sp. KO-2023]